MRLRRALPVNKIAAQFWYIISFQLPNCSAVWYRRGGAFSRHFM